MGTQISSKGNLAATATFKISPTSKVFTEDGREVKPGSGEKGLGLLALYKKGPTFEAIAIDLQGRQRPEWARLLTRRPLKSRRIKTDQWTAQPGWSELVHKLASHLDDSERAVALAFFQIEHDLNRPPGKQ